MEKFNRCSYQLDTEHYVLITNKLYDEPISKELKGFLILLKCKCLNGTNTTLYSQNRLAEELGLAKGTVSKYINEAEEKGYVKRNKKGIHLLREDIFLKTSESQLAIIKNGVLFTPLICGICLVRKKELHLEIWK